MPKRAEYHTSTQPAADAETATSEPVVDDGLPQLTAPGLLADVRDREKFVQDCLAVRRDLRGRSFVQLRREQSDSTITCAPATRRSWRHYESTPIGFNHFSAFLSALRRTTGQQGPRYQYGSAGGSYSVQGYIHVAADGIEGIAPGLYYYHPTDHRLIALAAEAAINPEFHFPPNRPFASRAAFSIFLLATPKAIVPLYGPRWRDFAQIEAGLISQLLESVASSCGIGVCQVGLVAAQLLTPLLQLDSDQEILHTLVGGAIKGNAKLAIPPSSQLALPAEVEPSAGQERANPALAIAHATQVAEMEARLTVLWQESLGVERVDVREHFFDLGGTSLMAVKLSRRIQEVSQIELPAAELFSYPSIRELAAYLVSKSAPLPVVSAPLPQQTPAFVGQEMQPRQTDQPAAIAIVGMAVRLPGASNLGAFWEMLRKGVCKVGPVPPVRQSLIPDFRRSPGQEYYAGYLSDIELFDALFFRISPSEAKKIDPAQRILLEVCYELLETAGYLGRRPATPRIAVVVGAGSDGYWNVASANRSRDDLSKIISGNMPAVIANRISHFFDLRGPSLCIDTACSSSLVAVDHACRGLLGGDFDMAIAAGANLLLSPEFFDAFRQDGMEAAGGLCRSFDAGADGFVRGEGVVAVLLKPLARAVADGDTIHAVVRGSATNHDGRTSSLAVPSPRSQQAVIEEAQRRAGITPSEISYVEAHGTGTRLGDPIEVRGLSAAFSAHSPLRAYCGIGSLKSNLGHLEYAAGIAGLVKTVLALQHRELPPSLHFVAPNPHIDFVESPFYVVDRLRPWHGPGPLRAGVSSFGVGGTNAHVILEEAPTRQFVRPAADRPAHLMTLSARSRPELEQLVASYLQVLNQTVADIRDICYTAHHGRGHFSYRLAIVARYRDQLCDKLRLFTLAGQAELAGSNIFVGDLSAEVVPTAEARLKARLAALPEPALGLLLRWCGRTLPEVPVIQKMGIAWPTPSETSEPTIETEAWVELLAALADLYTLGVELDWLAFETPYQRQRVVLPVYPFQRERYWWSLDAQRPTAPPMASQAPMPAAPPAPASVPLPLFPPGRVLTVAEVRTFLTQRIGEALAISSERLDHRQPLIELGMDSITAVGLLRALEQHTGLTLPATFFFDHPTINSLAEGLADRLSTASVIPLAASAPAPKAAPPVTASPAYAQRPDSASADERAIAVIGMAGRLPGARTLEELWLRLRVGADLITEVPPERWDVNQYYDAALHAAGRTYGRWGGFLDQIDLFDPLFFRLSDREAQQMDPQQRLLLETAWEALEIAGYAGDALAGSRTGVFIGASYTHLRDQHLRDRGALLDVHASLGNHNALLANRLSYFLSLNGPSLTVDTLCSSSLVALHLALRSLRAGECDQALVAGVHVGMSPSYYEVLSQLQAISPKGRCRTFDSSADGYVPGEGVVVVLLKKLSAAKDHDSIYGVIRGSAVNHGGQAAGLTVPNPTAQASVIRGALDDAGVSAQTITYIEAHGTGTVLGDPIEVAGITRAFEGAHAQQFCGIGSLKTNMGHLEPASGLAGLLKVLLSMRAGELPPTLHFAEPNLGIQFENTPCYVVDRLRNWNTDGCPRRAGISSFGLGGTNAHIIVEEAPPQTVRSSGPSRPAELLVLSARSQRALAGLAEAYVRYLHKNSEAELADICFTASHGRAHFRFRLALVARSRSELVERLVARSARLAAPDDNSAGPWDWVSPPAAPRLLAPATAQRVLELFRALSPECRVHAQRWCCGTVVEEQIRPMLGWGASPSQPVPLPADSPVWLELLPLFGQLYVLGIDLDWEGMDSQLVLRRIPLPTYPFERRVCRPAATPALPSSTAHPLLPRGVGQSDGKVIFDLPISLDHKAT